MLTYDLKIAAERLNAFLALNSPFTDALDRLVEWHARIDGFIAKIAAGGQDMPAAAGGLHSHISSTSGATREVNVEGFFASSADLSNLLKDLFPATEQQALDTIGLTSDLSSLRKLFSIYIAHQSAANALPLLVAASAFSKRLTIFQEDMNYFAASLVPAVPPEGNEDELSLVFHSDQTLNSFWVKLKAVEGLYGILCDLLDIDSEEYPLRIAKIESGSEWINLLGHAVVVGAIGKLLVETFKFTHRNYTTEGRIAATKTNLQQLDAIITIIGKLDKQKANTTDLKEQATAAAGAIAANLNDLLAHESRFVFGKVEVQAEGEGSISLMRRLQLKRTAPPQLGGPSSSPPLLGNTPSKDDQA